MTTKFGSLAKLSDSNRRVLNLYDEYVSGPRNMRREAEAITHILTKNVEQVETGERDRTKTWSASASGTCLRQQQFTFLGFQGKKLEADKHNIFTNGDYLHLRYQVAGLIMGWLEDAEVPMTYGRRVRGTTDGLLSWGEVLELKSINDRGYASVREYGPKDGHKRQATAYMLCTGRRATRFIYENKNTNDNCEFLFEFDEKMAAEVQHEWDTLDSATDERTLLPMLNPCLNQKGFDYNYCDFNKLCEHAEFPAPKITLVDA